jgi:hypothetical protein
MQDQGLPEAGPSRSNSRLGSNLSGKGRKKRLSDERPAYEPEEELGRENEGAALLGTNGYGVEEVYAEEANVGWTGIIFFDLADMDQTGNGKGTEPVTPRPPKTRDKSRTIPLPQTCQLCARVLTSQANMYFSH